MKRLWIIVIVLIPKLVWSNIESLENIEDVERFFQSLERRVRHLELVNLSSIDRLEYQSDRLDSQYCKKIAVEKGINKAFYKVDFDNLEKAMNSLSELILTLQGDGNYDGVAELVRDYGIIKEQLQGDLDMLAEKGIPVDVVFNQGVDILGI